MKPVFWLLLAGAYLFVARVSAEENPLRVFLFEAKALESAREQIRHHDDSFTPALEKLRKEAQEALAVAPFSVVNKDATPPSGDKHDYMSMAPYFWPNPETPDHLPYIRRDGERNPEIYKIPDRMNISAMVDTVETLALAHYFLGEDVYSAKAAELLRAWFLDPATRMNPNLEYAQAIRGVNSGRGIGVIETREFINLVDAVGMLAGAKAWTDADRRSLEEWFTKYLQWMLESEHGRDEGNQKNNHGTYYDLQVASFALFLGKRELATETLRAVGTKRIAVQIEPDGQQPLELVRTKAWGYSAGNLRGLMMLARLGEHVGVDLWNYQSEDGRCIRKALDFLAPYALGEQKWPHQQLGEWPPQYLYPQLRWAAVKFPEAHYRDLAAKLPTTQPSERIDLLRWKMPHRDPLRD